MAKRIQYESNIFFLTVMIRNLSDAVKLNVDTDYFAKKILEDCLFIDSTIQKLYQSLLKNNHLIHNAIHLHSIMRVKNAYGKLLHAIVQTDNTLGANFESHYSQLKNIATMHLSDVHPIMKKIRGIEYQSMDKNIISNDEFDFLLSPIE